MANKPGPSSTTVNNATLPPHITQGQQDLMWMANNLTTPFMGNPPANPVVGLTQDQIAAQEYARRSAGNVYGTSTPSVFDILGTGGNNWMNGVSATPNIFASANNAPTNWIDAARSPMPGMTATASQGAATKANAAQLAPGQIAPFMNPFISGVIGPVLDRLKQQQGEVQAKIGGDAAAAHSFGGSREAVSRMLADRNYRDTTAQTVSVLMAAGYDKASALALANTDKEQQANLTNANLGTQASLENARLGTSTSQSNAGNNVALQKQLVDLMYGAGNADANRAFEASKTNAGLATGLQQQLQQLLYSGDQANANRSLDALKLQSGLGTQDLNNQMGIINLLNSLGGQDRAVLQQQTDTPYTMLQRLAAVTPMAVPNSTTSTTNQTKPMDPLSILLGLGSLGTGTGTTFGGTLLSNLFGGGGNGNFIGHAE